MTDKIKSRTRLASHQEPTQPAADHDAVIRPPFGPLHLRHYSESTNIGEAFGSSAPSPLQLTHPSQRSLSHLQPAASHDHLDDVNDTATDSRFSRSGSSSVNSTNFDNFYSSKTNLISSEKSHVVSSRESHYENSWDNQKDFTASCKNNDTNDSLLKIGHYLQQHQPHNQNNRQLGQHRNRHHCRQTRPQYVRKLSFQSTRSLSEWTLLTFYNHEQQTTQEIGQNSNEYGANKEICHAGTKTKSWVVPSASKSKSCDIQGDAMQKWKRLNAPSTSTRYKASFETTINEQSNSFVDTCTSSFLVILWNFFLFGFALIGVISTFQSLSSIIVNKHAKGSGIPLANSSVLERDAKIVNANASPMPKIVKSENFISTLDRLLKGTSLFSPSLKSSSVTSLDSSSSQQPGPKMCPTQHSLMSQSFILRASFGNIFSLTTPPSSSSETAANTLFGDTRSGGSSSKNYDVSSVDTIKISSLSLRVSDILEGSRFEVWVFVGGNNATNASKSTDDIYDNDIHPDFSYQYDYQNINTNDQDTDPTNDNIIPIPPSKGEYSHAKLDAWYLISTGFETDLILDTEFFDTNGHISTIGSETTLGPMGRLDSYDTMEEVTEAAHRYNDKNLRDDGGMNGFTAEGDMTTSYLYKIPEEMFTPLKLPTKDGKLTLFVTLNRIALQFGDAAENEFGEVDVSMRDYADQVLNGDDDGSGDRNVDLRMHTGEGVIIYPWVEEDLFYDKRRFLGKVWYETEAPCGNDPEGAVMKGDDGNNEAPGSSMRPSSSSQSSLESVWSADAYAD